MIVFASLSQRTVMGSGNFMDLVQVCSTVSILRLRDGLSASIDTVPKSLIRRNLQRKQTVYSFSSQLRDRKANKERVNALTVIWWSPVSQGWVFGLDILLEFSSFFSIPQATRRTMRIEQTWIFQQLCVASISSLPNIPKIPKLYQLPPCFNE